MLDKFPVLKGVSCCLFHVPSLVRYGSKPTREISKDAALLDKINGGLRSYEDVKAYPPWQAFIGNLRPDELYEIEAPWYEHGIDDASRFGPFGEIMPEREFLALIKMADDFDLVWLEKEFVQSAREALARHELVTSSDLERLGTGVTKEQIEDRLNKGRAVPLYYDLNRLVGCVQDAHEEDIELQATIILENLACKASGFWAIRHLVSRTAGIENIEYVINCGEEASGDRYQRGGGSLAKAMAEKAGCVKASGSDTKAYCCAPIHAVLLAAGLVKSGIMNHVVVVGGGSLAKLGMKHRGHLSKGVPILEDVLGSIALLIGPDDGYNPRIRTDVTSRHPIEAGDSPPLMMNALIVNPLARAGLKLIDIDKFSLELHNPEITLPAGSGDPALNNYKTLASIAEARGEISKDGIQEFIRRYGMPGFSPTQGHIAAALPFLAHAREMMLAGEMERAMFVAKGSIFLGKMTTLSDGMSFLLERNNKGGRCLDSRD